MSTKEQGATALTAAGYVCQGDRVFRKHDGDPATMEVLLWEHKGNWFANLDVSTDKLPALLSPGFTVEEIDKAIEAALTEPTRFLRGSGVLRADLLDVVKADVRKHLKEQREAVHHAG